MKRFSISKLAEIVNAEPSGDTRGLVSGVSTDSRTIRRGDCFFAIQGQHFDGHNYLSDAFDKGAACAVVERAVQPGSFGTAAVLKVDSAVRALGELAGWYRRSCDYKVIAITGSVGKTTTRQITSYVLSRHYRTFQSPASFNNNIGLPLTLLGAGTDDEVVVAELGSNHPGEIAALGRIAQPDIAVVTNVHPCHLAGFGSLERIVQEKLSIADWLRQGGDLIIGADYPQLVSACRQKGIEFTGFGRKNGCDIRATRVSCDSSTSRFFVDDTELCLPLLGTGNVDNALAAWAVCRQMGLGIGDFARALPNLPAVSMRCELFETGTLTVLNDCYNANPASMRNALDVLVCLCSGRNRRRVFICGDMAELDSQAETLHVQLGRSIAQADVQLLLAVGPLARIAGESATEIAGGSLTVEYFADAGSVCNNLEKFIKDYDIILVKGSRCAALELVTERLKQIFT